MTGQRDLIITRLDVLEAVLATISTLGHVCVVMALAQKTMAAYMPCTGSIWYFGPTGDEW